MSSSFWVGNDAVTSENDTTGRRSTPASRGVINFADDLEAVLLTSLSANLYSCPGVDLYTRKMIKKTQQQQKELSWTSREAFVRDGTETYSDVGEFSTPPLRLQELLPVGHPVRTRVEEMVRASDLPRRIVVPPPCSGEEETMATIPPTTSTSSTLEETRPVPSDDPDGTTRRSPDSVTTTPLPERLQSSEGEEAEEKIGDAQPSPQIDEVPKDSVCDTAVPQAWNENGPSSIAVPAPTPQSALAKLVAKAKMVIPAVPTRTHSSSSDEDEEDEEEGVETRPFSSRSTALASSANARRIPSSSSSSASPSIGVKRERSSFLSVQEGEEDPKREPRRREDDDSTTLACNSPAEEEDREGRVKEGGGAESSDENPTNAKVLPKHPSQMTREEFLSQFKRAPRRGEIGLSAEEIDHAEALGYVMSGSRSKAAHLFVNRVQRQLHERDAAKRDQQFRQVEDERHDTHLIEALANLVKSKLHSSRTLKKEA